MYRDQKKQIVIKCIHFLLLMLMFMSHEQLMAINDKCSVIEDINGDGYEIVHAEGKMIFAGNHQHRLLILHTLVDLSSRGICAKAEKCILYQSENIFEISIDLHKKNTASIMFGINLEILSKDERSLVLKNSRASICKSIEYY